MAGTSALRLRALLLSALLLAGCRLLPLRATATAPEEERDRDRDRDHRDRDREGAAAEPPCEVKTVTVSTLPVLRENEFSFTGGAAGGSAAAGGGGGGSAAGAGGGGGGAGGGTGGGGGGGVGGGGGESRLLLFVRTDLPGRISVMDDLDNTALPYFTLGKNLRGASVCFCPP